MSRAIALALSPARMRCRAILRWCSVSFGLRPMCTPRATAALRPSLPRLWMRSRHRLLHHCHVITIRGDSCYRLRANDAVVLCRPRVTNNPCHLPAHSVLPRRGPCCLQAMDAQRASARAHAGQGEALAAVLARPRPCSGTLPRGQQTRHCRRPTIQARCADGAYAKNLGEIGARNPSKLRASSMPDQRKGGQSHDQGSEACRSASKLDPPSARDSAKPSGATLRCAPPALALRPHNLEGGQLFDADPGQMFGAV
jgi:hypothetical protein